MGIGTARSYSASWVPSIAPLKPRTQAASIRRRDRYLTTHAPEVLAIWPSDELEALWDFAETVAERSNRKKLGVASHRALWAPKPLDPICHHVGSMRADLETRWSKQNT
jgi:hypothetical protein